VTAVSYRNRDFSFGKPRKWIRPAWCTVTRNSGRS
jgi:hypothetical protein